MSEIPQKQRRKALLYRQRDVNYTTVSPQTGVAQCAGCRFFIPSGSWVGMDEPTRDCSCAIVESYPLSIQPTGWCAKYETLPADANEPEPMAVVIVEEPDVTLVVEDTTASGYIAPLPVFANPLRRFFGGKNPPGVTIFRSDSGLRRAVHITSNGYKDREDEHVATRALHEYVESQFENGVWHGDNVLDFYHEIDIGDLTAAVLVDGFLVEVSQERSDSPIATRLWDYWQATAENGSVIWGTSHEFRAARDGDTFVAIKKKKTSVLPIEDAANLYTYSEVLPMSTDFEKHLDKALGIDGAAKILRDNGINALNAALKQRGEVAKSRNIKADTDEPAEEKAPGDPVDFTALVTELLEVMAAHQADLDTLKAADEAAAEEAEKRKKAADTTTQQVDALKKDLAAQVKRLDTFMTDTPRRASEAEATRLSSEDEATAKANIDARNVQFDPMFPGMNVPLKDGQ